MKLTLLNCLLLVILVTHCNADFLGRLCGTQWGHSHFYPSSGDTVRKCIEHCLEANYTIAGLLMGLECFCQNDFGGYAHCRPGNTSAACNTWECTTPGIPCKDDPTMICGDTTWYSIYDSSPELHNVIYHEDTLVDQVCSSNAPECHWYCNITDKLYTYSSGQVFGSVEYDIHSSYCLSAAHDLRYIPNQQTAVVVKRESVNQTLEGSWRYGIQSVWKHNASNEFTVAYPRERMYLFADAVLYGFVDEYTRTLDCKKYDTASNEDRIFAAEINGEVVNGIIDIDVPPITELYCGLNRSDTRFLATYVPVITEPPGNQGVPYNRTVVVHEGDAIQFYYTTGSLQDGPWYVEKAGEILVGETSSGVVMVYRGDASIRMGGFYHLRHNSGALAATVRVIIVEKDRDLEVCGGFRGIPREDGTCLCFPPFGNSTNNCTGICNYPALDGTFGPNCNINCGAPGCQGVLICGEDPFGCHCASGWTGFNCTEKCPEGTFGPDCKGRCNCQDGQDCDRMTGLCPGGCIWGWFGLDCKDEGGYLKYGLYVLDVSYTHMHVGWKGWETGIDYGTVAPDGYWLECKLCTDSETEYKNVTLITYVELHYYTVQVTQLQEDTCYEFRIATIVEGLITPHPSPSTNGTTLKQL